MHRASTRRRTVSRSPVKGGNLSAVARRLRGHAPALAAQVLVYPGVAGFGSDHPSRAEFDGIILTVSSMRVMGPAVIGQFLATPVRNSSIRSWARDGSGAH
jgi:acetyl esterase/lipase